MGNGKYDEKRVCVDVDTKRFGWVRVLRAALKSCELDFFCAGFDLLFLMGNIWPTARSAGAMYVRAAYLLRLSGSLLFG